LRFLRLQLRMRRPAGIDHDRRFSGLLRNRDCSCDRKNLGLENK